VRIVSLLPSATEIICALGLERQLVAVSHECDYPVAVQKLPRATTTVIDSSQSSEQIDTDVRAHLAENSALYSLNVPVLTELNPQLMVTQALCDVCAVSAEEVDRVACSLPGQPRVLNLEPMSLADVYTCIEEIGAAAEVREHALSVAKAMQKRIESVKALIDEHVQRRPRVAFLEWVDPLFNGGHWTPELITMAGGIDVFKATGEASRTRNWEELIATQPEVLFVACCGFSTERAWLDVAELANKPGWQELPCVQANRVFVADGNQFFNRPGPRLADSLEILAAALHPEIGLPDPNIHRARRFETH